jgi:serine/threonine protein phosphatase 1
LQSPIVTFLANTVGRDFAVGDIHGCFSALQKVLDTVTFDPAVDRLFSVGDLVDRGPESHLVLEWLDKPWFHAIGGNHDHMAWRSALGDPYPHVDHRRHGGEWLDT